MLSWASHRAIGAREEAAHLRGRQPLDLTDGRELLKEQPRRALVANDRVLSQAALDQQIPVITLQQHLNRPVHDDRGRGRNRPDLSQILKRQPDAPRRDHVT